MPHDSIENVVVMPKRQLNVFNKRNLFVDVLAVLFGISSWIGVNSSYLQMPLIVKDAPEGWSLPTYMTVVVQSSNIMSFAYVLYQKYSPKKVNDGYLIYFTMAIGCITAIIMAFSYQNTMKINGIEHSVAYLICVFLFATVGTVSSVLFLPFMGRFRECYLVSYMCGQGMNGLFSTFLALVQGVGGAPECIKNNSTDGPEFIKYLPPPRFGTKTFFLLVFVALVVCTVAFILLNTLNVCKEEFAPGTVFDGNKYIYNAEDQHDIATGEIPENVLNLSPVSYFKLLLAIFLIGFFGNGIFPGLMSFSSLPYGYVTYHLAVTLANFGNSIGSLTAQFVKHTSIMILDAMVCVVVIIGVYIFYVSTQSPNPPFVNTQFGSVLIVSANKRFQRSSIYIRINSSFKSFYSFVQVILWIVFIGVQSYMKTSIAAIFRYQQGKSLVFQASVSLSCSVVGSIVNIFVVEYTNLFVSYEPC